MKRIKILGIAAILLSACAFFAAQAPDVYADVPEGSEAAAIVKSTGEEFATLPEAFEAAASTDTITMLNDYEVTNPRIDENHISLSNKTITLDLNGHSYRYENSSNQRVTLLRLTGSGTQLTVKDSSAEQNGSIYSTARESAVIAINSQARLVLYSGTIHGNCYGFSGSVAVYGDGYSSSNSSFTVYGGTVESGRVAICAEKKGTVRIYKGTITSGTDMRSTPAIWIKNDGIVNISGGQIIGSEHGVSIEKKGTLTARNCSITGDSAEDANRLYASGIYNEGGSATIGPNCQISGREGLCSTAGTMTISGDSTIYGKTNAIDINGTGSVTLNPKTTVEGAVTGVHMRGSSGSPTATLTVNGNDDFTSNNDVTIKGGQTAFDLEGNYDVDLNNGRYQSESKIFATSGNGTVDVPSALFNIETAATEIEESENITGPENMEVVYLNDSSYGPAQGWYLAASQNMKQVPAKAPTCDAEGNIEHYFCETCKRYFSSAEHSDANVITYEDIAIGKVPHEIVKVDAVASTCTSMGIMEHYECKNCHACFSDADGQNQIPEGSVLLPPNVHNWTKTDATEPTCTEDGNYEYWTCSTCGQFFDKDRQVISEGDWIIPARHNLTRTDGVPPTCTEPGSSEYWTCSECGKFFDRNNNEIEENSWELPAAGHEGEWIITEEAGLLKDGTKVLQCIHCQEILETGIVDGYANYYVKSLKVVKGKKCFTVKWKKQSKKNRKKFNGYEIRYSLNADMSEAKTVKASKTSRSKKIKRLAKKTRYYVQVRTYTKANDTTYYSRWSVIKTVKTK
ncbi:MAG: right-handed parallel beta-helix repeat-containing protein [Bacillota bacterium]|nr:right-handed parallel beta-helix repeat-containing protein [Bacillota bacterium]